VTAEPRLQHDVDAGPASEDEVGNAHLVPLSYNWDGDAVRDHQGGSAQGMETR
jgi:hypothetical protein